MYTCMYVQLYDREYDPLTAISVLFAISKLINTDVCSVRSMKRYLHAMMDTMSLRYYINMSMLC